MFIRAVVDIAFLAEKTFSAKGFNVYRHSVSDLDVVYFSADFFDNSHRLVSYGNALDRARHKAVLDMQIACAYTCESDFYYRVFGVFYCRSLPFFKREAPFVLINVCKHNVLLISIISVPTFLFNLLSC